MNKTTFLTLALTFFFNQAIGQTFKQQFNDLVSKKDTLGQQQLLEKWEEADSEDPELYVAYFNYYVKQSMKEIITLGQHPTGDDVLQLMDEDSSKTEPVAFIYGDTYYDPGLLKKGFNYIDKGIEKHPNRLDLRFGKIYILGQNEDYENYTTEIIETIDYSVVNNNKWTWADNKRLNDPKDFMLGSIQDYQVELYSTENDALLDHMKQIAEAVLKHYPDHIESLSNLSIVYMLQKDFDKALDYLLKAKKLDPKDYIVLSNIAQAYKLKGDTKNAIKYYKLTIKYGDQKTKNYAQGQIDELEKN